MRPGKRSIIAYNFSLPAMKDGADEFPFEGLTSGSKFSTAVSIIIFMLVIGGAFGIVMRTGTVNNGILALIIHAGQRSPVYSGAI